jgi:hypothetical protein
VPPGPIVNCVGATASVAPGGFTTEAVHSTCPEAALVTVRVHVHEVWQLSLAMDAMLRVLGSPGVVGWPGSALR